MLKIAKDWNEALQGAGLASPVVEKAFGATPLSDEYQLGMVSTDEFIGSLSEYLSLSIDDSIRAHMSVLRQEFAGIGNLVETLEHQEIITACLSNTNELHWQALTDPHRYPSIARLKHKVASQIARQSKPGSDIYRTLELATGCEADEIAFFDDVSANVEAASALGWMAFQVTLDAHPVDQISAHLASLEII